MPEVLPELSTFNSSWDVGVRRAQQENGGRRCPGSTADRPDDAILKDAEQRRLRLGRKLGDLVDEERPTVCLNEETRVRLSGAREGAARMAEERADRQLLGDGPSVHGDERTPPRDAVNETRHDLLTRPRGTRDEDSTRRACPGIERPPRNLRTMTEAVRRGRLAEEHVGPGRAAGERAKVIVGHEERSADSDDVAAGQEPGSRRSEPGAVHIGPILGPEVSDGRPRGVEADPCVRAADGAVREVDMGRRSATYHEVLG